jgi:hypothetical protein
LAARDRAVVVLPWSEGVVTEATSVEVTTETTLPSTGMDGGISDLAGEFDRATGSEKVACTMSRCGVARFSMRAGAFWERTRNIGTVKKTVDATAAADIRTRSNF